MCHGYGHTADTCVVTYVDKLRPSHVPWDDVAAEHLLDVSEIVVSSGEGPVAELPSPPGFPPDSAPECPPPSSLAVRGLSLEESTLSASFARVIDHCF